MNRRVMSLTVIDVRGAWRPFASEKLFDEWALKKIQCPVSRVCVLGLLHIHYEG